MSKPLTDAETRYWPTHLEMSGLVWAAKRLCPYMERAFVTFVTDHHSNVAFKLISSSTTSFHCQPPLLFSSASFWLAYSLVLSVIVYRSESVKNSLRVAIGSIASRPRNIAGSVF